MNKKNSFYAFIFLISLLLTSHVTSMETEIDTENDDDSSCNSRTPLIQNYFCNTTLYDYIFEYKNLAFPLEKPSVREDQFVNIIITVCNYTKNKEFCGNVKSKCIMLHFTNDKFREVFIKKQDKVYNEKIPVVVCLIKMMKHFVGEEFSNMEDKKTFGIFKHFKNIKELLKKIDDSYTENSLSIDNLRKELIILYDEIV